MRTVISWLVEGSTVLPLTAFGGVEILDEEMGIVFNDGRVETAEGDWPDVSSWQAYVIGERMSKRGVN